MAGHFAHHDSVHCVLGLGLEDLAANSSKEKICEAPAALLQSASYDQQVLAFLQLHVQPVGQSAHLLSVLPLLPDCVTALLNVGKLPLQGIKLNPHSQTPRLCNRPPSPFAKLQEPAVHLASKHNESPRSQKPRSAKPFNLCYDTPSVHLLDLMAFEA